MVAKDARRGELLRSPPLLAQARFSTSDVVRWNAPLEQHRRRRVRPARPSHALIEASSNSSTRGLRPPDRIHAGITKRCARTTTANNDRPTGPLNGEIFQSWDLFTFITFVIDRCGHLGVLSHWPGCGRRPNSLRGDEETASLSTYIGA